MGSGPGSKDACGARDMGQRMWCKGYGAKDVAPSSHCRFLLLLLPLSECPSLRPAPAVCMLWIKGLMRRIGAKDRCEGSVRRMWMRRIGANDRRKGLVRRMWMRRIGAKDPCEGSVLRMWVQKIGAKDQCEGSM